MKTASTSLLTNPDALVDPGTLIGCLAPLNEGDRELAQVRPTYVRAKRGTSALLGLQLTWRRDGEAPCHTLGSLYLARRDVVAEAAAKARTLRPVPPATGPDLAVTENPPGLFLAFPNDRVLRGLRAAADPRRLKNRLHRLEEPFASRGVRVSGHASRVEPVRWKPGRRAVLRVRLRLRQVSSKVRSHRVLYLRVYDPSDLDLQLARWCAARVALGKRVPQVIAFDPERGFLATEGLEGTPPAGGVGRERTLALLQAALEILYRADPDRVPRRDDWDELRAAARTLKSFAAWVPERADDADEALSRLRIARSRISYAPCRLVHGDLSSDQILEDGADLGLLDWDEAGAGDPHADLASLAVRGADQEVDSHGMEQWTSFSARVLGPLWREDRWWWHVAIAHARRCLAGLQRGEQDWRSSADRALTEALEILRRLNTHPIDPVHGAAASGGKVGAIQVARNSEPAPMHSQARARSAATLADLLDRERRATLPGVNGRQLVLAAVWPDGGGAVAGLEDLARPAVPTLWLRFRPGAEAWPFPEDPALPALRSLLTEGDWFVAKHRFARRAALRHRDRQRYLYLRPEHRWRATISLLRAVHEQLASAGVAFPQILEEWPQVSGWIARAVPGNACDPHRATPAQWRMVGAILARVHAVMAPDACPPGVAGTSRAAAARQIELVQRADPFLGTTLAGLLEDWDRSSEASRSGPEGACRRKVLIHGDLHPLQFVLGQVPVLVDWERARAGEPHEDLGNLLAHLAWELQPSEASSAWQEVASGYRGTGGTFEWGRVVRDARMSLLRVVAVHSWRDKTRDTARDVARWRRTAEHLETW